MPRPKQKPNIEELAKQSLQRGQATVHPLRSVVRDEQIGRVINIPIHLIKPNPHQVRQDFEEAGLNDLAASIKEHGLLQPLVAYKDGDGYGLIAGERRLRAAKKLNLPELPAYIRENVKTRELAIVENVQREDLHPLELAEGLQELKNENDYTNEALASVIGKSPQTISETLSLNNLPPQIKAEWRTTNIRSAPKTFMYQVLREDDPAKMLGLWEAYKAGEHTTVQEVRQHRKEQKRTRGRPNNFHRTFRSKDGRLTAHVRASTIKVTNADLRKFFREVIKNLT